MIIDKELMFSENQKVTTTANSTNAVDFKEPGDAVGQELTFHVIASEGFAGLTTLQVKIQTGDTDSSFEDVLYTAPIPVAKLTRGAEIFKVRVPSGLKRFVRLNYTTSGTASAGAITAFLSKEL